MWRVNGKNRNISTQTPYYDPRPDRKDPFTAALGSLNIVGIGQFYVGKWWRGIVFMALAILFFGVTRSISGLGVIVIWILAPIDAYDQAKKHNIKYGYSERLSEEPSTLRSGII